MRTADLDDVDELGRFSCQRRLQRIKRRQEIAADRFRSRHIHRCGKNVV